MEFFIFFLLSIFAGLAFCLFFYLLIRNDNVFKFRMDLIDEIAKVNRYEKFNLNPNVSFNSICWRYDWFHNVSYREMLYSLKPLSSFYPDRKKVLTFNVDPQEFKNEKWFNDQSVNNI